MSIFDSKINKSVAEAVMKVIEAEEKAKKDYDQDGKIESPKAEVLGSRIRAARLAGKLKEETQPEMLSEASYSAKAARAGKDIGKPGKEFSKIAAKAGKEYGSEEKGKKVAGAVLAKLRKEETEELDEAFPTVADAKKRMDAGKTSSGTVTKTKTGLVHKRDHDKEDTASDTQKKSKNYGARQGFERSTRVNEKPGQYKKNAKRPDDRSKVDTKSYKVTDRAAKMLDNMRGSLKEEKLSFTEMLQLYSEAGLEVIAKIVPEKVEFGDVEVEVFDADKINGTVETTVVEGASEDQFNAQLDTAKWKSTMKDDDTVRPIKKKADVAGAASLGVKIQKEEADLEEARGKEIILDKPAKHGEFQNRGKQTGGGLRKLQTAITKRMTDDKPKKTNEETEQIDEISKELAGKYLTAPQGKGANKYKVGDGKSKYPDIETMGKHATNVHRALARSQASSLYKKPDYYKEEEQLDELSKGTLGSYIKAASHDVATKGALTRHFADKSRREKEEKKGWEADKSMKKADKTFAAGWKRRQNMAKAVDRLTKEETQLDEKLPASASAGDYIHDFVHSDNPKFAGKSTKERQKMALGAFYAKNKGK